MAVTAYGQAGCAGLKDQQMFLASEWLILAHIKKLADNHSGEDLIPVIQKHYPDMTRAEILHFLFQHGIGGGPG